MHTCTITTITTCKSPVLLARSMVRLRKAMSCDHGKNLTQTNTSQHYSKARSYWHRHRLMPFVSDKSNQRYEVNVRIGKIDRTNVYIKKVVAVTGTPTPNDQCTRACDIETERLFWDCSGSHAETRACVVPKHPTDHRTHLSQ